VNVAAAGAKEPLRDAVARFLEAFEIARRRLTRLTSGS
jgi:hypothetical protein